MFISTVKYINYMMTKHTLQPFRSNPKTDVRGNLLLGDLMGFNRCEAVPGGFVASTVYAITDAPLTSKVSKPWQEFFVSHRTENTHRVGSSELLIITKK